MNKIISNIDFGDSYYKSFKTQNGDLTINIISWDNKNISIVFFNVIKFKYNEGSFIEDVYEITSENPFLSDAFNDCNNNFKSCDFKMFVVNDIDDCHIFEVVAEKVSITKSFDNKAWDMGSPRATN